MKRRRLLALSVGPLVLFAGYGCRGMLAETDVAPVAALSDASDRDAPPSCEGEACDAGPDVPTSPVCHRTRARVAGDLNGDGYGDIVLTGGVVPESQEAWRTVPMALSRAGNDFRIINDVSDFAAYAAQNGRPLVGDIDGDGTADIALAGGGSWWTTIPVAFSAADGGLRVTNEENFTFAPRSRTPKTTALIGDFDGDGRSDIAIVGGASWADIPVAFSRGGDGTFNTQLASAPDFATRAAADGVRAVSGDFDGDGKSDLALVGGPDPTSILVAYSLGVGSFRVAESTARDLGAYAADPRALVVSGDFDSDGKDDVALAGGDGWSVVVVAFARDGGTFAVTTAAAPNFAALAAKPLATLLAFDVDGDGCSDLALTGVTREYIPLGTSNGDGTFRLKNAYAEDFPLFARQDAKAASASQASRPPTP